MRIRCKNDSSLFIEVDKTQIVFTIQTKNGKIESRFSKNDCEYLLQLLIVGIDLIFIDSTISNACAIVEKKESFFKITLNHGVTDMFCYLNDVKKNEFMKVLNNAIKEVC